MQQDPTLAKTINPPLAIATFREAIVPKLTNQGLWALRHLLRDPNNFSDNEGYHIAFAEISESSLLGAGPIAWALFFSEGDDSTKPIISLMESFEIFVRLVDATLGSEKTPTYSFAAYEDWWSHKGPTPAPRREQCIEVMTRIIDAEIAKRLNP